MGNMYLRKVITQKISDISATVQDEATMGLGKRVHVKFVPFVLTK
jgi:hypothetical protein